MKRAWKFIALVLACSILTVSLPDKAVVRAADSTSESIAQKKDEINQAKEERKKLQQGLSPGYKAPQYQGRMARQTADVFPCRQI